jgi:hypothetical protein
MSTTVLGPEQSCGDVARNSLAAQSATTAATLLPPIELDQCGMMIVDHRPALIQINMCLVQMGDAATKPGRYLPHAEYLVCTTHEMSTLTPSIRFCRAAMAVAAVGWLLMAGQALHGG